MIAANGDFRIGRALTDSVFVMRRHALGIIAITVAALLPYNFAMYVLAAQEPYAGLSTIYAFYFWPDLIMALLSYSVAAAAVTGRIHDPRDLLDIQANA